MLYIKNKPASQQNQVHFWRSLQHKIKMLMQQEPFAEKSYTCKHTFTVKISKLTERYCVKKG